ncbi:MAG: histidine triad nucleotide-binding protein [Chloroflexi bacterium]|jgi:histidine triad (HIT) family protein|nr:histidine triad nucleotide-binding protein [Chloroflexota bacterium]
MPCIFCQIASKEISSELLHEDDDLIAFRDINPQAPVHILVLPKKHITSLNEMKDEDFPLLGKMAHVARELATKEGIVERGFRIAVNCGQEGGQTVGHLHMHTLGGRQLKGELG